MNKEELKKARKMFREWLIQEKGCAHIMTSEHFDRELIVIKGCIGKECNQVFEISTDEDSIMLWGDFEHNIIDSFKEFHQILKNHI